MRTGVGAQCEPRELRGRRAQPIQQRSVFGIRDPLTHGGEGVGHRVQHAPLALQQHEGGERAGVRIVSRLAETQRNRPIGASGHAVHERQLLALRADRQIERQLRFDDGVRATLKS